ncbi:flagellin [Sneathiella chinensis]|uniref:Flagellin n=1 Tax=Sneathiella chinensis TaxID=349750 RepID=A0ABQ5U2T3_9PROT|nr:flagellin [Sneathiella chinensis]GLQ05589.1 flagellin A [Sneathiella chinensis]
MAFSVNTNANAMAALRSLTSTQSNISNIQSQIQSGLKVGSATDDPSTFVISQGMRGDIGALKAVKEGLNFGSATVGMALAAATQISDQLTDLQKKVTQAENKGLDTSVLQAEADEMINQITGIVGTANFNGINLLTGAGDPLTVPTGLGGSSISLNVQDATTATLGLDNLNLDSAHSTITMDNNTAFAAGDFITFQVMEADGVTVKETHTFEFLDENAGALAQPIDEANNQFVHAVSINTADSTTQHVGALADAMREEGFTVDIGDDGTISVFNGGAVMSTDVANVAAGGLTADDTAGGGAIDALNAAKATIGNVLTNLGTFSNRLDSQAEFTQILTDKLEEGLGVLVDANLAEVSAKLQSEQTKEQLGIQSLSIANASSQSILGLFR